MKRRKVTMSITALAMFFLIIEGRKSVDFAVQGVDLCLRTVIPSLFPFFLLSIYLTGNLRGGSGLLPVLISGFLGGYPVGAQATAECFRTGRMTKLNASRLLMFCSQAGPAFLFGIVAAQFPEARYAWMLWAIQILSALSVASFTRLPDRSQGQHPASPPVPLTRAMGQAIGAMASVCGWVVIFRVILGFLAFLPLGTTLRVLLSGLLELANGCVGLGTVENVNLRFFLAVVMLNFGGLCVLLQTASVIGELDLRYYLLGKLLQTAFSVLYCGVFSGHWWALLPILCVFLLSRQYKPAKNSSIPARVGV